MSTTKEINKKSAGRSPGAPRDPDGVSSTLARLTGKSPFPNALRLSAYKYLRSPSLFPKLPGSSKNSTPKENLAKPGAHNLLLNALTLDEIFQGDTTFVVRILLRNVNEEQLAERCEAARREIDQRARIYVYWQQRMAGVESVLAKSDFQKERVAPLLQKIASPGDDEQSAPFALHAVRQLESIEQHPDSMSLTASDLVEKADAYLSLGDYATAAARATQAIDLEPASPRAWFVRVVSTLKARNRQLTRARRHRIEATEMAEPMSAHERWAHESADDAESEAWANQHTLSEIVPQALLNWPKSARWGHEHHEWRSILMKLLLDLSFLKIRLGGELGESRQALELNGFESEWALKLDAPELPRAESDPPPRLPFSKPEGDALSLLFKEHDRFGNFVFPVSDGDMFSNDFRLLHLRWVLGDDGYEAQWQRVVADHRQMSAESFHRSILSDATLAPLWFVHSMRHDGVKGMREIIKNWSEKAESALQVRAAHCALELNVLAFHHQYAHAEYSACLDTCNKAIAHLSGAHGQAISYSLPFEPSISVPATNLLHWQYLSALASVMMRHGGYSLTQGAEQLLNDADNWQAAFLADDRCFWTLSEDYEGGGGDDFPVPPYDIDLRVIEHWTNPVRERDRPFEAFVVHVPK